MKKKIIGIFVCMLLVESVLTSVGMVSESQLINEEKRSPYKIEYFLGSGFSSYDFIAQAATASWESGPDGGSIPFGGDLNDDRGFVCYRENVYLEDSMMYGQVLETHPKWVGNGYIAGVYPSMTITAGIELCVKVGFLEGAGSTDGVDFIVKFHEEGVETPQTLISIGTLDDGHLDEEVFSLSDFIGKVGSFILYVDARDSSGRDWAVWAQAVIRPELDIPEIEWIQIFGGNESWDSTGDVLQTLDGGYLAAGQTESSYFEPNNAWLIKTDSSGNKLWDKTFGTADTYDSFSSMNEADDGNFITSLNYGSSACLMKINSNGEELWRKVISDSQYAYPYSAIPAHNGGYLVVGVDYGSGNIEDDSVAWIVKTDENGIIDWEKNFDTSKDDQFLDAIQSQDDGYVIVGETNCDWLVSSNAWIVKTDMNGVKLWDSIFSGSEMNRFNSVLQADDDGYIVAGLSNYYVDSGNAFADAFIVKVDSAGHEMWKRTYSGEYGYDGFFSMVETNDGGYLFVGTKNNYIDYVNGIFYGAGWIFKTDSHGMMEWEMTISGSSEDGLYHISKTSDGYILSGSSRSFGEIGDMDSWLVKLKSKNKSPNKPSIDGPSSGKTGKTYTFTCVAEDPNGDQMFYKWDWGDETYSEWLGPYNSGEIASTTHAWVTKGNYSIRCLAKDGNNAESVWSDPLPVTMPYSITNPLQYFLEWLLHRFPYAFPLLRHMMG